MLRAAQGSDQKQREGGAKIRIWQKKKKKEDSNVAREKVPLAERKCHVVQDQEDTGEIDMPAVPRSSTWLVAPAGEQRTS